MVEVRLGEDSSPAQCRSQIKKINLLVTFIVVAVFERAKVASVMSFV